MFIALDLAHAKIEHPSFTAKRPAAVFMKAVFGRSSLDYGPQDDTIGPTRLFVLPSPSGLAIRWWDPAPWHALAEVHRAARGD